LRYRKTIFGAESVPYLLAALEDDDPIVRENALDELEGIADQSMVHSISTLLKDTEASVRQAAKTLLMSIKAGNSSGNKSQSRTVRKK
jgi:HEAT repeat protein